MINISTIIPVYMGSGLTTEYLETAVRSVLNQTHLPVEVILTDDSAGNAVKEWLDDFKGCGIERIVYVRSNRPKGVSSNSNFGANNATGEIIHFLHADDCITNPNVYENAVARFINERKDWLLFAGETGGAITIPNIEELNLFGVNSVGGPSSVFVRRESFLGFDESLSMLMDIEFMIRMFKKWGHPMISSDTGISYGSGPWQIQRNTDAVQICSEFDYLWQIGAIDISTYEQLLAKDGLWDSKRDASMFLWKTKRIRLLDYIWVKSKVEFEVYSQRIMNLHNRKRVEQ